MFFQIMKGDNFMKGLKFIIISAFLIAIFIMSVGYSLLSTELDITGTAKIVGKWDVKISNVEVKNSSIKKELIMPNFTNNSITFDVELNEPGDFITYLVTITNSGTIDAVLNNFIFFADEVNGSSEILFKTTEVDKNLDVGQSTSFEITITYNKNSEEIPQVNTKTITGIIEYVQKQEI